MCPAKKSCCTSPARRQNNLFVSEEGLRKKMEMLGGRRSVICSSVAVLLTISGYLYFFQTIVVLKNELTVPATNVRIGFVNEKVGIGRIDDTFWAGYLSPHQWRAVIVNAREFGHVRISLGAANYHSADETFEALEHNSGQLIFITLRDSQKYDFPDFEVTGYEPLGHGKFHTYTWNPARRR